MPPILLRRLAASATIALVLAGCADGSRGTGGDRSTPGTIAHPRAANQLVLRVDTEGGFVAPSTTFGTVPPFSLYGDGSVILGGAEPAIYPGPALPSLTIRQLTEPGMQAVLQEALDAGLADTGDLTDLGSVGIADAATTVFTLNADGGEHTVRVYALGMLPDRPPGMSKEEFATRTAFERLVRRLAALETWLPQGTVGADRPFDPRGARLYVSAYRGDPQLSEPPVAWPLSTPLTDFGASREPGGYRCGIAAGSDWTTLEPLAKTANDLTPWTSEGTRFAIVVRPLLPDETTC